MVVRQISVKDILAGHQSVPFGNRAAWKELQMDCHDLRRVHAHLANGTRPNSKNTKVGVVKKFLRNTKIARDGLLVVKQAQPFLPESELTVVPLNILHGLITSLHLSLSHPTIHQLTNVFNRKFYSLNVSDCVASVVKSCSQCQSLQTMPTELHAQSSTIPASVPLFVYAADVMRRCKQFILVLRDTFSSYTSASIMPNEQHDSLRSSLIIMISTLRPNPQSHASIRVDTAPGFKPLKNDSTLSSHKIALDFGRVHNKNKNPVIEKGIRELGSEIIRVCPEGGAITKEQLAVIINQLNSRIRGRGLSAWEILNQRDQYTGEQIDVNDLSLSEQQSQQRATNQESSARHKAHGKPPASEASVRKGSLVYIKSEGDKVRARDRYLVTDVDGDSCTVQKFVKSQLRSQRYQLKLTEVYPVSPEVIEFQGPIRDLDDCEQLEQGVVGEDNYVIDQPIANVVDRDPCVVSVPANESPAVVPVPANESPAVDTDFETDFAGDMSVTGVETNEVELLDKDFSRNDAAAVGDPEETTVAPRRTSRTKSRPVWMRTGEYEVEG